MTPPPPPPHYHPDIFQEEVPKPPSPEEIAAEAALEVIASKKVGADLVSWVKSQEGTEP
jgi:hypothetical protein